MKNYFKILKYVTVLSILIISGSYTFVKFRQSPNNPKISKLKLQAGFVAEHLMSPSEQKLGSWVAMAFDNKGRMITSDQYGGLFRLTIPAIGSADTKPIVEKIMLENDTLNIGAAHGLLYAFNSLYIMVNNVSSKNLPKTSGFYRLQDTDGNDKYDKLTLLKELKGDGEHGPHSVILSPDKKSLYVISGNHTDVPEFDTHTYLKNYQEDNIFPLIKDPRGHANDRLAPGGWVANVDSTGKRWNIVSAGYRNAFDMVFNDVGDLFVYDADMEWDFGLPWYRPTRICHATSASEFGWRTGNSKWPANFPDNLPPVINIGQGSPTNLLYLKNAKFPTKYNQTLLAFDWSFGIIHAIHLKPSGATYTAEREEFLSGIPLPLTDGTIGPDGALYFLTGGRRLESDLYRVYYNGPENTQNPTNTTKINSENELRRTLEKFHIKQDATVIYFAWPHLKHPDRFVRYAARLAIEHQPSQDWQQKALTEKDPIIAINSLLALTRNTDANNKDKILAALLKINFNLLNEEQKIDLLRVYELVFVRLGKPDEQTKTKIATYFFSRFPTISKVFDQHLARILVNVDSPGIIEKIVSKITSSASPLTESVGGNTATNSADLILRNPQYGLDIAQMLDNKPPALQVYYAILISNVKTGWTPTLSEKYFSWYKKAFTYKGGLSYVGFLERARKMALQNVPENKKGYYDKLSGGEFLNNTGNDIIIENYPKGPYKYWKADETNKLFETELVNRDYKQGKSMYDAVTCSRCHSMLGQGGNIGPDLSQLASRFTTKDILEAIMEPNKVISDQYAATQFELKNGQSIVGRLVNEDKANYSISQNPYAPDFLLKVSKNTVVSKKYSTVSVMLPGLINPLNQEELKDLMAYLIAGGKQDHKIYNK